MADIPAAMRSFAALLLLAAAPAAAINVGGTDSLAPTLGVAIERHLAADGRKHKVDFRGSLPALEAIDAGELDVALLLVPDGQELARTPGGKALRRFPLGAAAAYVYVHSTLDLKEIDLATLAAIFGAGQKDDYRFWSDVPGIRFQEPIVPFTSSDESHPGTTLFNGIALAGRAYRPNVRLRVAPDKARDLLMAGTNTILVSASPMPEGVGRLLRVADGRAGRSKTAYYPDDANVYNGDYPLRLPLVLCVPEEKVAANREFLAWLLSDVVASELRKAQFIPSPAPIRERLAQRLDSK